MKKIIALALALVLCMALATAACADASVYYLNFKPEQDAQWQELAKVYTEKTGVPVTVVTAASGQYETTLMAEMERASARPCSRSTARSAWRTGLTTATTSPAPACRAT